MGDLVEMFFPGIRNGFNPEAYIREAQSADFNMQNIHVEPTAIGPVGNVLSTEELVISLLLAASITPILITALCFFRWGICLLGD